MKILSQLKTFYITIIMNINKKTLTYITLPVLTLGIMTSGVGIASAYSNPSSQHEIRDSEFKQKHPKGFGEGALKGEHPEEDLSARFTQQATLLGVSIDEVKNAWAGGKDFKTLAQEKGISEQVLRSKMDAARETEMKIRLAANVASGKITQAQADAIIAQKATHEASMKQILATALGISTAELDTYKAAGKTPEDIIKEKGLNADTVHQAIKTAMDASRLAEETSRIQALVAKGVITQDQANKRIETLKTKKSR